MTKLFLCFIWAVLPQLFLSTPVFLEAGGSKICTLNTIGKIPVGSAVRPVYQKVCRQVIPTLGDFVDDSSGQTLSNEEISSNDDKKTEKVRRSIIGIKEKRRACGRQK